MSGIIKILQVVLNQGFSGNSPSLLYPYHSSFPDPNLFQIPPIEFNSIFEILLKINTLRFCPFWSQQKSVL